MEREAPRLIAVPFHDGLMEVDRGRGPGAILDAAGRRTPDAGRRTPDAGRRTPGTIAPPGPAEPARVFAVATRLAERVREVRAGGGFPVVLAGDCNSCLGTVAGCGPDGLAVVWFDAHPDFDDPDDSGSGSLDAMGLALLTGRGWQALRATIPGLVPLPERDVALLGVRDFEPAQRERLARSDVHVVPGGAWSEARASEALDAVRSRVARVYLHVDLDVLDRAKGSPTATAPPTASAPSSCSAPSPSSRPASRSARRPSPRTSRRATPAAWPGSSRASSRRLACSTPRSRAATTRSWCPATSSSARPSCRCASRPPSTCARGCARTSKPSDVQELLERRVRRPRLADEILAAVAPLTREGMTEEREAARLDDSRRDAR